MLMQKSKKAKKCDIVHNKFTILLVVTCLLYLIKNIKTIFVNANYLFCMVFSYSIKHKIP